LRQKVTATVIALVLGSFAAVGAFASQGGVSFGGFSGGATTSLEPGVDTPTSTATVDLTATATAADTSTPEPTATGTAVPAATDTPAATETAGPTETAIAGCKDDAEAEADNDDAVGTPAAGGSQDDCDDAHEDQGKHEGLECGKGHADDNAEEDGGGTPTAPAETPTPDTSGTPTIVAELPVHCHGEHGVEHDEGLHLGDEHSGGGHD